MLDLYAAVCWAAYTSEPKVLAAALAGSAHIVVARLDGALVGLARVISDSATTAYLQDVLFHPAHQRHDIGAALVQAVLRPYERVRQKVLLTDDQPEQRAFYTALGWRAVPDGTELPLRAFVRVDS